jgi:hypothetical protein
MLYPRNGSVKIEGNEVSARDGTGVVDDPGIVVKCLDPKGRADIRGNWVHHCDTAIDLQIYDESVNVGVTRNFLDDNKLAVGLSGHDTVGDHVRLWENRCSGNSKDFDGNQEWTDRWSEANTAEDKLSEHMQKVRSLGLGRRLEKLATEGGTSARWLKPFVPRTVPRRCRVPPNRPTDDRLPDEPRLTGRNQVSLRNSLSNSSVSASMSALVNADAISLNPTRSSAP